MLELRADDVKIEFLYFPGCPNADAARAVLSLALSRTGIDAEIQEVDTSLESCPAGLRDWGSPTILIDDQDLMGRTEGQGPSCRLYPGSEAHASGAPPLEKVVAALELAARK